MYIPNSFRLDDEDEIIRFIEEYSFGVLISSFDGVPEATHLPFLVKRTPDGGLELHTHMARANKQWKRITEYTSVLAVFHGPHAYISPDWYVERETVPTWNYSAVHMSGKARLIHDPKLLKEMALELTRHHEDSINSGWSLEEAGNLPDNLSKAITGVIIEVKKTEAVMKFNQNRSVEDQREVIKHLDDNYAPGVREIMERNLREK